MQPTRPQPRGPGSFSPLPPTSGSNAAPPDLSRPRPRRVESSSSEDSAPLTITKARTQAASSHSPTPIYAAFTQQPNSSTSSLHNFSRPTPSSNALSTAAAAAAGRQVGATHHDQSSRSGSPLTVSSTSTGGKVHSRKHSQTAGLFDSTLPSASMSNLSQVSMGHPAAQHQQQHRELSTSQIAAQAAVMHHQNQQSQQSQQQQHARQRSQTVPVPGENNEALAVSTKRGSGGPLSPPMLSLTEASGPRESGFGNQAYHNGLLGSHHTAAQTAANVVFPRSGQSSPNLPTQAQAPHPPPPPPPPMPEKKPEKSKVKLFSRPGKVSTKAEPKEKPLPSPSKIGSALASLQRGNFSTTSLDSLAQQSFYSLANSSTATIRPVDTPPSAEREAGKEKEKKHHFLSRQKHRLKDKDDYHLPLSSAASNSRPTDPNAPSSLYNFNLPPSPGPTATTFKSMSGLDLRHGGRALRDKKKEDKAEASDMASILSADWPGPSSVNSSGGQSFLHDVDPGKYGLNSLTYDDAWPFLKAKLLIIFQGEDLRIPVEDLNRIVTMHIQYCIQRRSPNIIVEDLREFLSTGFASLDHTLRMTPEDKMIPRLVELWVFAFTSVLPYMQAVFLPLDLEFTGSGSLLTPEQARDFWGGVLSTSPAADAAASTTSLGGQSLQHLFNVSPVSSVLDVRRLVLASFRDIIILPRYDMLKTIFSRLSLEFLPQSLASMALASPIPIQAQSQKSQQDAGYGQQQQLSGSYSSAGQPYLSTSPGGESTSSYPMRPGTSMSLDPSLASYNSNSTTLLGDVAGSGGAGGGGSGSGNRSRAISNVSFGSGSDHRPFTPGGGAGARPGTASGSGSGSGFGAAAAGPTTTTGPGSLGSLREQNVEDSKQVTEMVGRMLQCMSVLAGVGVAGDGSDEGNKMIEELCRLLKLNWLGRGRTGRNRRGMVGGRVKRGGALAEQGAGQAGQGAGQGHGYGYGHGSGSKEGV